jgi:hypothetical protein
VTDDKIRKHRYEQFSSLLKAGRYSELRSLNRSLEERLEELESEIDELLERLHMKRMFPGILDPQALLETGVWKQHLAARTEEPETGEYDVVTITRAQADRGKLKCKNYSTRMRLDYWFKKHRSDLGWLGSDLEQHLAVETSQQLAQELLRVFEQTGEIKSFNPMASQANIDLSGLPAGSFRQKVDAIQQYARTLDQGEVENLSSFKELYESAASYASLSFEEPYDAFRKSLNGKFEKHFGTSRPDSPQDLAEMFRSDDGSYDALKENLRERQNNPYLPTLHLLDYDEV